jgi:hypothetical protein
MSKSKSKTTSTSDQYGYNVGGSSSSSRSKNNAKWLTDAWEGLYGDASSQAGNLYGNQDWASGAAMMKGAVGPESLGLGGLQSGMQTAGNVAGFTPGMFTDVDMNAYMNPYQQQVIDAAMGDLERQRQIQMMSTGDAAQAAGAFGGSRHGVAEAETNRGAMDIVARTAAGLRAAGYDQAAQLAMGDIANQMQGQGLNLQAAGMLGDMGNMYQQMGLQGAEALQNLGLAPLNLRLGVLAGTPGGLGGTSSSSSSSWNQGQNWGTSQSTGTQRGGIGEILGPIGGAVGGFFGAQATG